MKFQYYEKDPMDEVPAPFGKVILSFGAITAVYVGYLYFWSSVLGG